MPNETDLKSLRMRLGWNQERMADELGLDRSSVSRMENGVQAMSKPVRRLVENLILSTALPAAGTVSTPLTSAASSPSESGLCIGETVVSAVEAVQ